MAAQLDATMNETLAGAQVSTPFWLVTGQLNNKRNVDLFQQWGYIEHLRTMFTTLRAYHNEQVKELQDSLNIRKIINAYDKTLTLNLALNSGGVSARKRPGRAGGVGLAGDGARAAKHGSAQCLADQCPTDRYGPIFKVDNWGTNDRLGAQTPLPGVFPGGSLLDSYPWFRCARLAYSIANRSFAPPKVDTPADTFEGIKTTVLAQQLPVIGKTLLAIGFGKITFKDINYNSAATDLPRDCYGSVLTMAGASSSIPSAPVGINTFVHIHQLDYLQHVVGDKQGMRYYPIKQVNPYGEYRQRFTFDISDKMIVDAARFDNNGALTYYDDISSNSQSIFNTQQIFQSELTFGASKQVNIPVFRGCQVECYQRVNPKTLNAYARFDYLTYPSLDEPDMHHIDQNAGNPAPPHFWNRTAGSPLPCSTAVRRTRISRPIAPSRSMSTAKSRHRRMNLSYSVAVIWRPM